MSTNENQPKESPNNVVPSQNTIEVNASNKLTSNDEPQICIPTRHDETIDTSINAIQPTVIHQSISLTTNQTLNSDQSLFPTSNTQGNSQPITSSTRNETKKQKVINYMTGIKSQVWPLLKTALPFLVLNMCIFILGLEDMIVVGHIPDGNSIGVDLSMINSTITNSTISNSTQPTTQEYLAAYTLGTSIFNAMSVIALGLIGNGQEPLVAKAFGAGNGPLMLAELIRSLLFQTVVMIPLIVIMYFSGYIAAVYELIETTQNALVSRKIVTQLTITFMRWLIPGLIPFIYSRSLTSFMIAQNVMWPSMIVSIVSVVFNILMGLLLVFGIPGTAFQGWGFIGSPIASSLTRWFVLIGTVIIFLIVTLSSKERRTMFKGFTWKLIFQTKTKQSSGIGHHLKISLPGTVMMSAEIWGNELATFISGFLGTMELSAHGIVLSISNFVYMFPMSLSMASTVCIAHRLGSKNHLKARLSAHTNIIVTTGVLLFSIVVVASTITVLPKIYTQEESVIQEAIKILPVCLVFIIVDGYQAVFGGILRGVNRQFVCAVLGITAYFVFGFPLGCVMAFVAHWDLIGLWLGFTLALTLIAVWQGTYWYLLIDWEKQVPVISSPNEDELKNIDTNFGKKVIDTSDTTLSSQSETSRTSSISFSNLEDIPKLEIV